MNPVVVHVHRPYASEEQYLAAEAWSIEARSMLLIGAESLPPDTAVLFDVGLDDGHKPIRAEGRVVGDVPAQDGRPAGLKVRFKRFGAATKAFIERAVQAKQRLAPTERDAERAPERYSLPDTLLTELPSAPLSSAPHAGEQAFVTMPRAATPLEPDPRETSGIRVRGRGPVAAPSNREELLERLRQRKRQRQAG